ncbi:MAG: hypothetical protein LQ346_003565 [Caloplaca aetnensis]|nr:MAG: hypothetical protein LQ346_003565 [Caloplaca aetnensis]
MTGQDQSLEPLTAMQNEHPFSEAESGPSQVAGPSSERKRTFEGNPLEAFKKMRKATEEAEAAKVAEEARLRAEDPASYANIAKTATETVQGPFRFDQIKYFEPKVAMIVGNSFPLGGPRGQSAELIQIKLRVNGGLLGRPQLRLTVRLSNPKQQGRPQSDFETLTMIWTPSGKAESGRYQIEDLQDQPLQDWKRGNNFDPLMVAGFPDMEYDDPRDRLMSFESSGAQITTTAGFDASLLTFPEWIRDMVGELRLGTVRVYFIYIGMGANFQGSVPWFQRCVEQRLPRYFQYRDENGNGRPLISNINECPDVTKVGGGMYVLPNTQIKQLPATVDFPGDTSEFFLCCALTAIREAQFQKQKNSLIKSEWRECFVYQPRMAFEDQRDVSPVELTRAQRSFDKWVLIFVRLPAINKQDLILEEGSVCSFEWQATGQGKLSEKKYYGTVVRPEQSFTTATRTDFCVCVFMPPGPGQPGRHGTLKDLPTLPRAMISLQNSIKSHERELAAVNSMSLTERVENMEFLDCVLKPSYPSGHKQSTTNLAEGLCDHLEGVAKQEAISRNKKRFRFHTDMVKKKLKNRGQNAVLDALTNVKSSTLAVVGPAGTGKTRMLVETACALLQVRHKLLICAPGNGPVDHVAVRVAQNLPQNLIDDGIEMLRMSVQTVEKHKSMRAILSDAAIDTTQLPDQVPDNEPIDIEQDPRIMEAARSLMTEHATDVAKQEEFENHLASLQAVAPHITAAEAARIKPRGSKVFRSLELSYHFQRVVAKDLEAAQKKLEELKSNTPESDWPSLPKLESLNPSHAFRMWHNYFAWKEGILSFKQMQIYMTLREEMTARIIQEVRGISTTLNTAGDVISAMKFDASVIIVDDAGQASFPSLFVPLQNIKTWKAVLLFGDPRQLKPMVSARGFSEVLDFSGQTALQALYDRRRNVVFLTANYRMAPAICHFPSKQFYEGKLTSKGNALEDNDERRAFRKVSMDLGVHGPDGNGSEYYLYDVIYGESHVEENGTSLLNHANADAICGLIDRFLAAGISPQSIVVVTMYKAQLKLLILKIARMDDGQLKYHLISTADAFQGQEGSVVILDLVVAKYFGNYKIIPKSYDRDEEGQEGATNQVASGGAYTNISTFARDHHRLCVALTRAQNGLVIVGQIARLLSSLIKSNNPMVNTLYDLAKDALERKLVAHDKMHLDTHPETQQKHVAIRKRQDNLIAAAQEDAERQSFYQSFLKWGLAKAAEREASSGRGTGFPLAPGGKQPPPPPPGPEGDWNW